MRTFQTGLTLSLALLLAGCAGDAVTEQPRTDTKQTTPAPSSATTTTPAAPETRASVVPKTETPVASETTTEPAPDPEPTAREDSPRSRVPKALVGTWDGDRAQISFSRAGDVTITFKKGGADSGTVVIDGSSMTLYLSSGVQTINSWEISRFDAGYGYEFFNLTLDGTSYVRDVPK